MKDSLRNDQLSFLDDSMQNPLAPIPVDNNLQKNPVFYNSRAIVNKTNSKVINILAPSKNNNKFELSSELQDFLAQDETNSNLNIVTFIGPKEVGKSFLVDFLVSKEEKSITRQLSKGGSKPYINMPTTEVKGKNGQKIIYFDSNDNISNECFLWTYFLSSIVVINIAQGDKKGEEQFISKLDNLRLTLESNPQDLSLPQLIILRRDSSSKQFKEKDFLRKVQEYGLFNSDIVTMNMAFPGSSTVASKDIRDVGQNLLSEAFVNDALSLQWVIKSGKPKTIKGNYLGSKIAGLTLDPLTKSINKLGKVSTNKIWTDVIETLSVGYYNYYIKKYSQQLQKQFSDEEPCDKYTLYKRLSKVRRNVDKKVQGFNTIAGDPTFQKYKEKLQEKINNKEKIIREINRQKSIKKNDELCKKIFSEMNDNNCEALIQKYCESNLDDNKAEVLLDNFETVIKKRLNQLQKSKNPSLKPSTQIQQLEKQLKQIEDKIQQEKRAKVEVVEYDFNKVKANIQLKEKQVKELQQELEKQKKISNEKKNNQNKDIIELENKIQNLKSTTKEQEKQIEKLRLEKEQQAKKDIQELTTRLKQEEEKHQKLQEDVKKAQAQVSAISTKPIKPTTKDTCCEIM